MPDSVPLIVSEVSIEAKASRGFFFGGFLQSMARAARNKVDFLRARIEL